MAEHCRACQTGLEHCHGTLITHPLHGPQCTADGCASAEVTAHVFVIDCEAVGCGCPQAIQPIGSVLDGAASATGSG